MTAPGRRQTHEDARGRTWSVVVVTTDEAPAEDAAFWRKMTPEERVMVEVLGLAGATAIAAGGTNDEFGKESGGYRTCAIVNGGKVRCWGDNDLGELGDGTRVSAKRPVEVRDLTDVVAITTGFHTTCALQVDGHALCWGGLDPPYAGTEPVDVPDFP